MEKTISGEERYFGNTGLGCGRMGKSAFRRAGTPAVFLLALTTVASAAESCYVSVEADMELAAGIEGIYDGEEAAVERRIEHSGGAIKYYKSQDRNDRPWCCQAERFAE